MKKIGLIGGMSWESSVEYYRLLNQGTKKLLGGLASCNCLMYSVNFAEIAHLQKLNDWDQLSEIMIDAAKRLEQGGAESVLICANTMHLCYQAVAEAVDIPVLHIAAATAEKVQQQHFNKVGLLGTRFTMERDFYKQVLKGEYAIDTVIPDEKDRLEIHRIIYEELVQGKIKASSKDTYLEIIHKLSNDGAQGVLLACTEIPLLITQDDLDIPVFDTTAIHVDKALTWALN